MSKTIQASGEYKVKSTGEIVGYTFDYAAYDSLQDEIDTLGEDKVFSLAQRMAKIDASNTAREAAKVDNGHSSRTAMTEDQKAKAKVVRSEIKTMASAMQARADREGITVKQLMHKLGL